MKRMTKTTRGVVSKILEAAESLGWHGTAKEEELGGEKGVGFEFDCDGELGVWCCAWMPASGDMLKCFLDDLLDYCESFDPDYQTRVAITETDDWTPVREILAEKENEERILWDFYHGMEEKCGEIEEAAGGNVK